MNPEDKGFPAVGDVLPMDADSPITQTYCAGDASVFFDERVIEDNALPGKIEGDGENWQCELAEKKIT